MKFRWHSLLWFCLFACGVDAPPSIGVILPLSGNHDSDGRAAFAGIQLLRDELVAEGAEIQFEILDNHSSPSRTLGCVRSLVQNGATILLAPPYSNTAMAAVGETAALGVPMIAPSATRPEITRNNPFSFRACFLDSQQATAMARFARQDLDLATVAIVVDLRSLYSVGLANYFAQVFEELGGAIVRRHYFRDSSEIPALVLEIASTDSGGIYLPFFDTDVRALMKGGAPLWAGRTLLGSDGWDTPAFRQGILMLPEGSSAYLTNHFDPSEPSLDPMSFASRFRKKFGRDPDQLSALAYDSGRLAVAALARATDASSPQSVRFALANLNGVTGATGSYRFDVEGNPMKSLVVQRLVGPENARVFQFVARIDPNGQSVQSSGSSPSRE